MLKLLISGLMLMAIPSMVYAPTHKKKSYYLQARITAYNLDETDINHKGKRIFNSFGCAVPSNTLPDGALVEVIGTDIKRIADDRIPRSSVNKHKSRAKKRGKKLDVVIDLRYHNIKTNRGLCKKDLGYRLVRITTND